MRRRLPLFVVWLAAACVEGQEITAAGPDAGPSAPGVVAHEPDTARLAETEELAEFCELLPAAAPCSLACDRQELLDAYVPEGVCVVFACALTDGRTFTLSHCNHADGG